ncbi:MAG: nuclear transport factor 2 family protein [Actinomycetota bacterium]
MAWWDDYLDAWNAHDGQKVVSFMTPDAVYADVAIAEEHKGHSEIATWVDDMADTLSSDYSFEAVSAFDTKDGYALEWIMKGTHDRSNEQLPATGKPFAIHGASVGQLEKGKIKRNTDYWNFGEFLMQVGMMPPG